MTRDNATSRAREATGYIGAMSTLTDFPAGTGTPAAGPAPAWSLAAALLASPATLTHGLRSACSSPPPWPWPPPR